MKSTPEGISFGRPYGWTFGSRLSNTRTRKPSSRKRLTKCDPIKPAPPVTSTLIPVFSCKDLRGKIGRDFVLADKESFARSSEDLTCGLHKDFYVQYRGPATHVIQVELHPLVEILYIVPAGDLPETRYARFHRKLLLLIFSKTGVLTDEGGSGTDQTHVAFEHAVKLGKFIQAVATHPIAESGYAGIVRQFKYWAPHLIERFQLIFQLVGIEAHGAKLIPHEGNASLTNNLPSVERRPARRQFDSRCQCQK